MNPNDNAPQIKNPLRTMQAGEQNVCEIKRHPIGIFTVYAAVGFLLLVASLIIFAVIPALMPGIDTKQLYYYGSLVMLLAAFVGVVYAMFCHIIYWGNRWVITSDSLTQIEQSGLFTKQASQLSLESLEDVTAERNGILTTMFNYGVLKAETAGERSKFVFLYCPDPNKYAQMILDAREHFVQHIRAQEESAERPQTNPAPTPNAPTDGYTIP